MLKYFRWHLKGFDAHLYADAVACISRFRPSSFDVREIEAAGCKLHVNTRSRERHATGGKYRFFLEHPTVDALNVFVDWAEINDVQINYLESALDFVSSDRKKVQLTRSIVDEHAVHRHCRHTQVNWARATRYTMPRKDHGRTCLVSYADRKFRHGPGWASHTEIRVAGAAKIRKIGISRPEDLRGFNLYAPWEKWVRWQAINFEALGRQILARGYDRHANCDVVRGRSVDLDVLEGQRFALQAGKAFNEKLTSAMAVRSVGRRQLPNFAPDRALCGLHNDYGALFPFASLINIFHHRHQHGHPLIRRYRWLHGEGAI